MQLFKRLVATSRAPQIVVLSMLRSFGKIVPQIDQIWAWLSRRHRWSAGVQNPLKGWVTGLSLLVNCYLSQNSQGEPPPLNHERCSLSGSTVYPGVRFGVSLKLHYPETDILAESFCCRSC